MSATGYSVITDYKTTLTASMTSNQATLLVASVTTKDGHVISMADLGAEVYLVIEPGGANMEIVKCSGVSNAPPSWTGATRGMAFFGINEASVPANQLTHNAGATVIMTNAHFTLKRFVDKEADEDVNGIKNFLQLPQIPLVPVLPADATSKAYVDAVVVAGAPNATLIVKGIVQLAADADLQAGTEIGGTGASLAAHGNNFNQTPAANKVPVADGAGHLAAGWGGAASTLATLDAGSLVVQNPANATSTPTVAKIPIATAGPSFLNSWIDGNSLTGASTNINTFVAGEAINAAVTPLALYFNSADGKVYKLNSSAAAEAAFAFIGFAIVQPAVAANGNILVQTDGLVAGFAALAAGNDYYGTNAAGVIGLVAGTQKMKVGRANSVGTGLLIEIGKKIASGTTTFNATATTTITVGFPVVRVRVNLTADSFLTKGTPFSNGGWSQNGGNNCVFYGQDAVPNPAAGTNGTAWLYTDGTGGGQTHSGIVDTITTTTFRLNNTKTNVPPTINLFWEAEGE